MENYFCANSVEEQVDYLTDKVKDIITNKLDKASIVQETGTGTDVVMSQKAVTDAIANKGLDTLTGVNLTVGNTTVQYDTTDGIQLNSIARFQDASGNHDATMDLDLPVVGTDGIVIKKAADSEKIEISGDNFVKKLTDKVNYDRVYGVSYSGLEKEFQLNQYAIGAGTIPVRLPKGSIRVGGPDDIDCAISQRYADNNYRKALETEVGQQMVYASGNGDPNTFLWAGTEVLDDQVIVVRGNNGCIYTNMPDAANTKDTTVPNKKYVDDAIASHSGGGKSYKHLITVSGTKSNGALYNAVWSIVDNHNGSYTFQDLLDKYFPYAGGMPVVVYSDDPATAQFLALLTHAYKIVVGTTIQSDFGTASNFTDTVTEL